MGIIFKTNGQQIGIEPENGKTYTLKELQAAVGGYIGIISILNGQKILVFREDISSEFNIIRNSFILEKYAISIFGDVLICPSSHVT